MKRARDKTALFAALERWLPRLEALANEQGVAGEGILDEALEQVCSLSQEDYRLRLDRKIVEGERSGSVMIDDLAVWQAGREEGLRRRLNGAAL